MQPIFLWLSRPVYAEFVTMATFAKYNKVFMLFPYVEVQFLHG
jgi:hypothetical protein